MTAVNADDFKGALGSWAAGVTVVTTKHEGSVYGITASSFSSLSLDPMLVLVCLANSNKSVNLIEASRVFAVSILAEGQEEISAYFARSGREPEASYERFGAKAGETGSPVFNGGVAYLDCALQELLPGGDHTIAVGRVVDAGYDSGRMPLMYFRRGYRKVLMS